MEESVEAPDSRPIAVNRDRSQPLAYRATGMPLLVRLVSRVGVLGWSECLLGAFQVLLQSREGRTRCAK